MKTYFDKVIASAEKHGFRPDQCKGLSVSTPVAFSNAGHCLSRSDCMASVVFVVYNSARLAPWEHAQSIKEVIVVSRAICEGDDCFDTPSIRICGERDDPHGSGSESLPLQDVDSPAEIAAALTVLVLNRVARYGPGSGWCLWECPESLAYGDGKPMNRSDVAEMMQRAVDRMFDPATQRNSADHRQD